MWEGNFNIDKEVGSIYLAKHLSFTSTLKGIVNVVIQC